MEGKPGTLKVTEDILILKLIRIGDKQAFKELFDSYFIPLCRFARIYIGDHHTAEEVVLDVFASVWEKREQLEIKISWKAYLFQAVKNKAFNYIRDNDRFVQTSDWSTYEKYETDHSLEVKELENLIWEAVNSLPDLCKDIFVRSREANKTNKEIAGELNISVKYVEAQITKALKQIKKYLGESYSYLW